MKKGIGYMFPSPIDPGETVCFQVTLPKHVLYLAAFWSSFEYLTTWHAWQRDDDHSGLEVATVMRSAYELSRLAYESEVGCIMGFDVRQNEETPCELDKSSDGGETWEPFANLQLCPPIVTINPMTNQPVWWNPTGGGGAGAWEDIPTGFIPGVALPPVKVPFPPDSEEYIDDTARCFAAAQATSQLKRAVDEIIVKYEIMAAGGITSALVLGGLLVWTGVGILLELAVALVGFLIAFTQADLETGFTDIDWPNVRDHLACFFNRDGTISESGLADFRDWMATQYADNGAWGIAKMVIDHVNAAGLTADGGIPGGDIGLECAEDFCPPEYCSNFDFTTGMHGFYAVNEDLGHGSLPSAIYVSGVGWKPNPANVGDRIRIQRNVPTGTLVNKFTGHLSTAMTGDARWSQLYSAGGLWMQIVPEDDTVSEFAFASVDFSPQINWSLDNAGGETPFDFAVTSVEICGDGYTPEWD